jgi:UDP-N-acetylmuramate--alanine ligase
MKKIHLASCDNAIITRIHFIGIGGIGVSALARYFLAQGTEVSGSDVCDSPILRDLKKLGAKIFVGHKKENLPSLVDLVVYTAAATKDNPELKEAKKRKIKCQTYAQALGDLTKQMFTIAVSGMHGKSTTTAMIGLILEAAGFDPTVIVGTKLREWGNSNCRVGRNPLTELGVNDYLVIEADEYRASFLNYWPKILVLTNIEPEHLDYYTGGLPHIIKTFREYVSHLPKDGWLVANSDDKNISKIKKATPPLLPLAKAYQKSKLPQVAEQSSLRGRQFKIQNYNSNIVSGLKLKITGKHNISNANAALAVAKILGIADKIAVKTLNNFSGTWRRMEYKGRVNGAKIFDDYGHHPTEIKATLEGARELLGSDKRPQNIPPRRELRGRQATSDKRLWCVFQPHQYQRTHKLFKQFLTAFGDADKVIILPIYSVAGREKESIKKKVSSEKLVKAIARQNVIYLDNFNKTAGYLKKNLKKGDVCVIMGAGDVYKLTEKLIYPHT